ncbi:PPC domain-containing DNA-binding protein [Piscinibacter terrae]|uniref:DNA-binding protein n=1 Tax=Piscinibacter terrae TaxID=2496871 RepID=A0A3N7HX10_9BURK|nr:PPC domain-containing DNA-binding protein [Albitalea terrae]RQP26887.1 DNA-binding protein [Albitalea terrae]
MRALPLRLTPGQDLRLALQEALAADGAQAAFVVSGIGSLALAQLRMAGAQESLSLEEDLEILTLSGSVTPTATHLHISVSRADGSVLGGHVGPGCTVRTTAEVLLAVLPGWRFTRERDEATGWDELVISRS